MRLITVVNPHRVYSLVKLWAQSGTRASGKTSDGSSNTTVKDGEQCGGIVGGRVRHARRLRNGDVRKGKMRPPSAKKKRKHDTVCPKGEGSTNILSALDFLLSGPSQPGVKLKAVVVPLLVETRRCPVRLTDYAFRFGAVPLGECLNESGAQI